MIQLSLHADQETTMEVSTAVADKEMTCITLNGTYIFIPNNKAEELAQMILTSIKKETDDENKMWEVE